MDGRRGIAGAVLLSALVSAAPARAEETLCNGIDDDGDGRLDESPNCLRDCRILNVRPPVRVPVVTVDPTGEDPKLPVTLTDARLARTPYGWAVLSLAGDAVDVGEVGLCLGDPEDLADPAAAQVLAEVAGARGMDLAWGPPGLAAAWSAPEPADSPGAGGLGVFTTVIDPETSVRYIPEVRVSSSGDGLNGDVVRPRVAPADTFYGLLVVARVDEGGYERIALTRLEADNRRTEPVTELTDRVLQVTEAEIAWTGDEFAIAWSEVTEPQDTKAAAAESDDGLAHVLRLGVVAPGAGSFREQVLVSDSAERVGIAWAGPRLGVAWQELGGSLRFNLYDKDLVPLLPEPLRFPAGALDGGVRLGWNGGEFALIWPANGGLWTARVDPSGEQVDRLFFWADQATLDHAPVWDGRGWGLLTPDGGASLLLADCYCDDPTEPDCPALYRATARTYGPYGYSCRCAGTAGAEGRAFAPWAIAAVVLGAAWGLRRRAGRPGAARRRARSLGAAGAGILAFGLVDAPVARAGGSRAGGADEVLVLYGGLPASTGSAREVEELLVGPQPASHGGRIAHLSEFLNLQGGQWEAGGGVRIVECGGRPPPDLDAAHTRAGAAMRRLDYSGALSALDGAAAALPCSDRPLPLAVLAELYFRRGLVLFRLDQAAAARESFRQAFLFQPSLPWDDDQPPRILRLWSDARTQVQQERGGTRLSLFLRREERLGLAIDGLPGAGEGAVVVPRGLHLLSTRTATGPVQLLIESEGSGVAGLVSPDGRESLFLAGSEDAGALPLLRSALSSLSAALGYDVVRVVSVPGADPGASHAYRYERRRDDVLDDWERGERRRRGPIRAIEASVGVSFLGSGPYAYIDAPVTVEAILARSPVRPRLALDLAFSKAGPGLAVFLPQLALGATLHAPTRRAVPFLAATFVLSADGRAGPTRLRPGVRAGGGLDLHPPRTRLFLRVDAEAGIGEGGLTGRAGFGLGMRL